MANQVELLGLSELKLIGLTVTCPFTNHNPARVDEMRKQFAERKDEIHKALNPERFWCPHFTCDVLFTYMICMEVEEIAEVPEGMIGFIIPSRQYAKTRCRGDPYQVIHDFLKVNELENDNRALALEMYRFEKPVWPEETDVFIPIK